MKTCTDTFIVIVLLLFYSWQTNAQVILSLQRIKLGALYNTEQKNVWILKYNMKKYVMSEQ